ncbi:MAG TPA: hypothetical protein VM695_10045 [Phycisphaerae bacterium]|nr:hypothetical protein [Phycisphaerae bacterium]
MCGLPVAHRPAPDFLSGLRPDGTCDESKVNGDLLWRVLLACRGDCYIVSLHVHWNGEGWDSFAMGRSYHHAHPVAALLLAAGHARLLDKGEGK